MSKVIGRYKSNVSGTVYDFIDIDTGIVISNIRDPEDVGTTKYQIVAYTNEDWYTKVKIKIVIGGIIPNEDKLKRGE